MSRVPPTHLTGPATIAEALDIEGWGSLDAQIPPSGEWFQTGEWSWALVDDRGMTVALATVVRLPSEDDRPRYFASTLAFCSGARSPLYDEADPP